MTGSVLAVVTARGGSKGLPGKNLRMLHGRSLLGHAIAAALEAGDDIMRTVLTTDDPAIREAGEREGAWCPFLRPAELATDKAGSLETVQHAVRLAEQDIGRQCGWVLLLQPTSPMRVARDITCCIELSNTPGCSAVISVLVEHHRHPVFARRLDASGLLHLWPGNLAPLDGPRRQEIEDAPAFPNGAVFLTRRDVLMDQGSFWGERPVAYVMPAIRSIDIDTAEDLQIAEALWPLAFGGERY